MLNCVYLPMSATTYFFSLFLKNTKNAPVMIIKQAMLIKICSLSMPAFGKDCVLVNIFVILFSVSP